MNRDPLPTAARLAAHPGPVALLCPEPATEVLMWHRPADRMPDADLEVLLWLSYEGGATHGWLPGFWDGELWREWDGWPVKAGRVVAWACPGGPAC